MQKKLIALAIAGLASSAAFAQTNVTIYGVADVSFESSKAEGASAATGVNLANRTRVNSSSSLLGFKGTEDLGDGLSAIFQFETNMVTDSTVGPTALPVGPTGTATSGAGFTGTGTGNATPFGGARDTYVGLKGTFGTIKAGYLSTPLRGLVRGYDIVPGSTGIGEIGGVFAKAPTAAGGATAPGNPSSYLFRAQGIAYTTPNYQGFEATGYYSGSEGKSGDFSTATAPNSIDPKTWNLSATYDWNGFKFGYSYLNVQDAGVAGLLSEEQKTHIFGVSYDFGQGTTLTGLYQRSKDEQTTAAAATTGEFERNAYWLGLKHVEGANEFALAYSKAQDLKGGLAGSAGALDPTGTETGAKQVTLRYARVLSKRTQVYGVYSKITNENNAAYDFNTNAVGAAAGADPQSYGVGIRHSF